ATRVPHWDDHPAWRDNHRRSVSRIRRVLSGRQGGGYGVGRERSIAEYEDRILTRLFQAA
ncbi:MAG: hypothetical protein ACREDI_04190, partial [Roseiarcus sp.]